MTARRPALPIAVLGLCVFLLRAPVFAAPAPCALTPRAIVTGDFDGDGKLDVAAVQDGSPRVFVYTGNGAGSLEAPRDFDSGLGAFGQPTSIVAGHFTNSVNLDLAVAGIRKNTATASGTVAVAILRGDGHGSFSVVQTVTLSASAFFLPLANRPTIVAGNFNGDGLLGLAATDGFASVYFILQPLGGFSGSSVPVVSKNLGAQNVTDIVPGHFNSEFLDLAAGHEFNAPTPDDVKILFGDGDGGFPTGTAFQTSSTGKLGPRALAVGHFNNDAFLDVAVLHFGSSDGATPSNRLSIFFGNGTGNFTLHQTLSLPPAGRGVSLTTVDFDNDFKPDLAAATFGIAAAENKVFVLRNDGSGTFSVGTTFNVPTFQLSALAAGDFDGDGLPDLVVSSFCFGDVKILLRPDAIAPTTVATVNPVPNGAGWNMTSVTVTLTATDNPGGSSVREIRYALDGGPETVVAAPPASPSFTTSFPLSTEATTTVTYHAVDNAGNVEAVKTLVVKIDKTAPTTTATPSPPPNLTGFNTTNVDVTLNATDLGGSSVKNITFSAVGAQPIATTTVAGATAFVPTITVEGTTTLIFFAIDNADNQEVAKTLIIKIDRIAPELEARCAPPGQSPFVTERGGTTPVAPIASGPLHRGEFKRQETYRIVDDAGNQLDATFGVKSEGHELRFTLLSLVYNGGAPVMPPENLVKCEWAFEKNGTTLKELEQKLEIRHHQADVRAKFRAATNQTEIRVHRPEPDTLFIRAGVVFLRLTTNNGQLGFDF